MAMQDQTDTSTLFVESPINAQLILNIRWLAILGQFSALIYTYYGLKIAIPIVPCLFVIGLSVVANIWQTRRNSRAPRKGDQNFLALVFDVLQLSALLFLTGGLLNPFASMLLAPVVVSAAVLRRRETFALIMLVAANVSGLAIHHYPLPWNDGALIVPELYLVGLWISLLLAALFIGGYAWRVASGARRIAEALSEAKLVLAKEQQATALGTLATAAAHQLGSPLNTITVVSHELARDINPDDPIYEDVMLLREQAERCRVILAELDSMKSLGGLDLEPPQPLTTLIETLLNERVASGMIEFTTELVADSTVAVPMAKRRPELIQALDNILSNAEDYAASQVLITVRGEENMVEITVTDDGEGFASSVLARIGQPWNSVRSGQAGHRGLGIFIAQTLIGAIGGSILFKNSAAAGGFVQIRIPRTALLG